MPLPFLNPWMLLAAAGAAVPVLIHLFNRHRYKVVEWAAMHLLRRAVHVRARQIRLQDLLLMAARCLIMLLVALAAARPTMRLSGPAKDADVGAVIALDISASMRHAPGVESRFSRAVEHVRTILKTMPPGTPVTLALMGQDLHSVARNTGYDEARFLQMIEDIKPSEHVLDLDRCLLELRPLVEEIKAPQREIYIVTDGQRTSWGRLSEKSAGLMHELGSLGRVTVVAESGHSSENMAVTQLELASGLLQKGAIARYSATVHNFGDSPRTGVEVRLYADESLVETRFVGRVDAGKSVPVAMHVPLRREGDVRLRAEVSDDELVWDNTRRAVARVRGSIRVLCVDGSPSDRPFEGAADFVLASLASGNEAPSSAAMNVTSIPWLSLPSVRLADYDVVILADLPEITDERLAALRDFVEHGGGLFVFAGRNTKMDESEEASSDVGGTLLPVEMIEQATDLAEAAGVGIDPVMPDHLITRSLSRLASDMLADCRFRHFIRVRMHRESRAVLCLTSGDPLLIEGRLGRGKVLFFASSPDRAWHNMVVNPAFPIMLQQALADLSRTESETAVTVGQPLTLRLPAGTAGSVFTVTDPASQEHRAQAAAVDSHVSLDAGVAMLSGYYEFRAPDSDGLDAVVAANADVRESDARCLSPEAMRTVTEANVISGEDNIAAAVRELRVGRELWLYFALAAAAMLIAESIMARRYTRRKKQPADTTGKDRD